RMRWCHRTSARHAAEQPLQQEAKTVADEGAAVEIVPLQNRLDLLPALERDDRCLLAIVNFALVTDLSGIGDVREQLVQAGARERLAAAFLTFAGFPAFVEPAQTLQLLHHGQKCLVLSVELKDLADAGRFGLVD